MISSTQSPGKGSVLFRLYLPSLSIASNNVCSAVFPVRRLLLFVHALVESYNTSLPQYELYLSALAT